jgi:ATP-dependent DNA helicase RecG
MLGDLAEGGMLGGSEIGTRVALLTGSQPTSARKRALLDITSGAAGIVVGTHALLQDPVDFLDLALVVVDEQHRFGVEQRDALRSKGKQPPHVLVMTATPIPRTVAMTVFGDLETSTLRELPRGRQPITTHAVPHDRPAWVARTWERVAEEVRAGRQAYVVCPRISAEGETSEGEDLEDLPEVDDATTTGTAGEERDLEPGGGSDEATTDHEMASVEQVHADLTGMSALAGLTIEQLHGRMSPEDKDDVMSRFAAGQIDVLVSTTVIEVGVDVPNASVMVILDAERFGVSQLHQLRGRVGRGGHPGLCLLVSGSHAPSATERLEAVAGTTDGFELARLDLGQRREGDVLGTRQSGGRSHLEFLSLLRDEDLVVSAREDAVALVARDPSLAAWPELAREVAGWAEAEHAAYLEKG